MKYQCGSCKRKLSRTYAYRGLIVCNAVCYNKIIEEIKSLSLKGDKIRKCKICKKKLNNEKIILIDDDMKPNAFCSEKCWNRFE